MINHVVIVGRITTDLEIRRGASGVAVLRFNVACDRRSSPNTERKTDFVPCVVFGKTAETIERYFKKGRMIALEGSINVSSYDRKDGTKGRDFSVNVSNFSFCDSAIKDDNSQSSNLNSGYQSDQDTSDDIDYSKIDLADDDLPF